MRRAGVALLALSLSTGCALFKADRATVGDFLAARLYHEDRYERLCVDQVGPPDCAEMHGLLQLWKRLNDVANESQKVGDMPAEQAKEIRAVWAKVKALP